VISTSCALLFSIIYFVDYFHNHTGSLQFRRFLINSFTFIEFFFLAAFIGLNLENKKSKFLLLFFSFAFTAFLVYFNVTSRFTRIDSIPIGIESLIIISFSFYFLYERVKNPSITFIYNDYRFWIIIGMIIYLAGSFFIYIYGEQLEKEAWKKFRYLTLLFYIIRALFFSIGIIVFAKRPVIKNKQLNKTIPYLDIQ